MCKMRKKLWWWGYRRERKEGWKKTITMVTKGRVTLTESMSVCLLLKVRMKRRTSPICTNVQDIDRLWHSQSWSMSCIEQKDR